MSQAKVDRYKEQKKNRKQIMQKEKREWMLTKAALGVMAIAIVGFVGGAAYSGLTQKPQETQTSVQKELPVYTVNTTAIDEFIQSIAE